MLIKPMKTNWVNKILGYFKIYFLSGIIQKAKQVFNFVPIKIILVILIVNSFYQYGYTSSLPQITDGKLDLRTWDLKTDGIVELSGEWKFYWKNHISPKNTSSNSRFIDHSYIQVPGSWNGLVLNGEKIPGTGYATYYLEVLLKSKKEPLALKILDMATAYKIFINGKVIDIAGFPGTSKQETIPLYSPKTVAFIPETNKLDIVVHVSNFHHRQGGMWETIQLGTQDQINDREKRGCKLNCVTAHCSISYRQLELKDEHTHGRQKT